MWQTEQNASYAYDSVVWVGYETQKSIEIKVIKHILVFTIPTYQERDVAQR